MIEIVAAHIIPAAYAVLPPEMNSPKATALLIAIGLQESQFIARRQDVGPARSLWQFEAAGVRGVLTHERSAVPIRTALRRLLYKEPVRGYDSADLMTAIEHNDVLAACFARCLLWTSPRNLPEPNDVQESWSIYLSTWRPGRPRQSTWSAITSGHGAASWPVGSRAMRDEPPVIATRDHTATDAAPTPIGSRRFELARHRLAQILGKEDEQVTDAEVIAYLRDGVTHT